MKDLFVIAVYTILQTVKKKVFLISNIIIAIFILLIFIILGQYLEDISKTKNQIDVAEDTIPIILLDNTGTFGEYIYEEDTSPYLFILISEETIQQAKKDKDKKDATEEVETIEKFIKDEEVSFEELEQQIKQTIEEGKLTYAITVENTDLPFCLKFLCNKDENINETEKMLLVNMLTTIYKKNILKNYEINILEIDYNINYYVEELTNKDEYFQGGQLIALAVSVLLFLAIYLYGHAISTSISSEKMSRIIETLVTSTKPRLIVIGKTIGMGVLGLIQLIFLILVVTFSYRMCIPVELDVVTTFLETINIDSFSVTIMFVFFMLGYLLYAFAFAVVGAIISKTEDAQIANMPLSIVSLLSFYLSIFTMDIPSTSISKFASFFPFSSAFAIPAKLIMGYINIEEAYLSIIFLIISIVFIAFCAIRIYSNIILNYGNKVKFKDLFNLFIKIE